MPDDRGWGNVDPGTIPGGLQDRSERRRADPESSGYRPEYSGSGELGNVGSGPGFGADLYQLYRAGRVELPETAGTFADLTTRVHREDGPMESLFVGTEGSLPLEAVHRTILELRVDLQDALRRTCINVDAAATALVEIADAYVATDEQAVERFRDQLDGDRDDFRGPRMPPLDPPAPGPVPDAAGAGR